MASAPETLPISVRSPESRATSGKLTSALITVASTAPNPATLGGSVPDAARFADEATALALETTPPIMLTA